MPEPISGSLALHQLPGILLPHSGLLDALSPHLFHQLSGLITPSIASQWTSGCSLPPSIPPAIRPDYSFYCLTVDFWMVSSPVYSTSYQELFSSFYCLTVDYWMLSSPVYSTSYQALLQIFLPSQWTTSLLPPRPFFLHPFPHSTGSAHPYQLTLSAVVKEFRMRDAVLLTVSNVTLSTAGELRKGMRSIKMTTSSGLERASVANQGLWRREEEGWRKGGGKGRGTQRGSMGKEEGWRERGRRRIWRG